MSNPQHEQSPDDSDFDVEQMRYFMSLSVEEKLKHLEQLNQFTHTLKPESGKKVWEQLQKEGF